MKNVSIIFGILIGITIGSFATIQYTEKQTEEIQVQIEEIQNDGKAHLSKEDIMVIWTNGYVRGQLRCLKGTNTWERDSILFSDKWADLK